MLTRAQAVIADKIIKFQNVTADWRSISRLADNLVTLFLSITKVSDVIHYAPLNVLKEVSYISTVRGNLAAAAQLVAQARTLKSLRAAGQALITCRRVQGCASVCQGRIEATLETKRH